MIMYPQWAPAASLGRIANSHEASRSAHNNHEVGRMRKKLEPLRFTPVLNRQDRVLPTRTQLCQFDRWKR